MQLVSPCRAAPADTVASPSPPNSAAGSQRGGSSSRLPPPSSRPADHRFSFGQRTRLVPSFRFDQMPKRLQIRQRLPPGKTPLPLATYRTREPDLQQPVEVTVGRLEH